MCITINTKDGRTFEKYIEKALGSLENPISNAQMDDKTRDLCRPMLGHEGTEKLIETCRNAANLANAADIARVARP